MTLTEQQEFLEKLIAHKDTIFEEYQSAKRRAQPLPDWEDGTLVPNWKGVALWWDYKPWPFTQRKMPTTTKLIREGPSHRASGLLILDPQSKTPKHNHLDWGNKIILHLPITVPEGDTGFWVDDKIHHWKEGKLFAFDVRKDHYGYNNTDHERALFVLDFDAEEWGEALSPYMSLED